MKECFAQNGGECTALKERNCSGCSFYNTIAQHTKETAKALRRIKKLDLTTRLRIKEKYSHYTPELKKIVKRSES